LLRKLDSTLKSAEVLLKCPNNASHKQLQRLKTVTVLHRG